MADLADDEGNDFDDTRDRTKWAITVDTETGSCIAQQIGVGTEIGEYETDLGENVRVAAFFDDNVKGILDAVLELGGHSIECQLKIADLLNGVSRSFSEAESKLAEWSSLEKGAD